MFKIYSNEIPGLASIPDLGLPPFYWPKSWILRKWGTLMIWSGLKRAWTSSQCRKKRVLSRCICICGSFQGYGIDQRGRKAAYGCTTMLLWICFHLVFNGAVRNGEGIAATSWYETLINHFKQRTPLILKSLQQSRYTLANAKERKDLRQYVQDIVNHAWAAQIDSIYDQRFIAWQNLDWQFRLHIREPTTSTAIQKFHN